MVGMSKAKPEPRGLPKRFYQIASYELQQNNYQILLDGKAVLTQARQPLEVPTVALAQAVAEEWMAQQTVIDPDKMPLTRLMNLALDRMDMDREAILAGIAGYIETDLIFYRAESTPHTVVLQQRQAAAYDPILQWVKKKFAAGFEVTNGIMPVDQNPASIARIAAAFAAANAHELAGVAMLVSLLGSALLALAVWYGEVDADTVCVMVRLDENFQAETWGHDAEAQASWLAKENDIRACVSYLSEVSAQNPEKA